jgi:hypothetical protein
MDAYANSLRDTYGFFYSSSSSLFSKSIDNLDGEDHILEVRVFWNEAGHFGQIEIYHRIEVYEEDTIWDPGRIFPLLEEAANSIKDDITPNIVFPLTVVPALTGTQVTRYKYIISHDYFPLQILIDIENITFGELDAWVLLLQSQYGFTFSSNDGYGSPIIYRRNISNGYGLSIHIFTLKATDGSQDNSLADVEIVFRLE